MNAATSRDLSMDSSQAVPTVNFECLRKFMRGDNPPEVDKIRPPTSSFSHSVGEGVRLCRTDEGDLSLVFLQHHNCIVSAEAEGVGHGDIDFFFRDFVCRVI